MAKWSALALAALFALLSIGLAVRAQDFDQRDAQPQDQPTFPFDTTQHDPRFPNGLLAPPNNMELAPKLVQPPSAMSEPLPDSPNPLPALTNPLAKQAEPAPREPADRIVPKLLQPDLDPEDWGGADDDSSCMCDTCDCEDRGSGQCDDCDCDCDCSDMLGGGCECCADGGKLGHRWRPFGHLFSKKFRLFQDHGRHHPWSEALGPLYATSWLNRPYFAGVFMGGLMGNDLLPGRVERDTDMIGGVRGGWDFDHYWGGELRLAFAEPRIRNHFDPPNSRSIRFFQADVSVAYYPFGDTVWRPFATLGIGATSLEFDDERQIHRATSLITLPVGGGVKFMQRPWLIYRADIINSIAFGNEVVDTLNNVTFTLSVEIRFGGHRRSYFPWAPERTFW